MQQQQPARFLRYVKSKDCDGVIEETYDKKQFDEDKKNKKKTDPVSRRIITRVELNTWKENTTKGYKNQINVINNVFNVLNGKLKKKSKSKKKSKLKSK